MYAVVAQLVEHWLPKPRVTGSSPAYRSGLHQMVLCDNMVFLLRVRFVVTISYHIVSMKRRSMPLSVLY